jgi:F0F1-type ATP synthase membrane subunit b/b'
MSRDTIRKAKDAERYLEDAEDSGREAKRLFEEIKDPDGARRASEVEKVAREAKEYVEKKVRGNDR